MIIAISLKCPETVHLTVACIVVMLYFKLQFLNIVIY